MLRRFVTRCVYAPVYSHSLQSIYGFRGASAALAEARPQYDFTLGTSFRFGPRIAAEANFLLRAKAHYDDAFASRRPVVVGGSARGAGCVVTAHELAAWHEGRGDAAAAADDDDACPLPFPYTYVFRTNRTMFREALALLGVAAPRPRDDKWSSDDNTPSGKGAGAVERPRLRARAAPPPRLCFSVVAAGERGGGSSPMVRGYLSTLRQLHDLRAAGRRAPAGSKLHGFATWADLMLHLGDVADNEPGETDELAAQAALVEELGDGTPAALAAMAAAIVDDPAAADVVLTTTHKAKGLEWPRVRVANDFVHLVDEKDGEMEMRDKCKVDAQEIHCLYVACTRAQEVLCSPESLTELHAFVETHPAGQRLGAFSVDDDDDGRCQSGPRCSRAAATAAPAAEAEEPRPPF